MSKAKMKGRVPLLLLLLLLLVVTDLRLGDARAIIGMAGVRSGDGRSFPPPLAQLFQKIGDEEGSL